MDTVIYSLSEDRLIQGCIKTETILCSYGISGNAFPARWNYQVLTIRASFLTICAVTCKIPMPRAKQLVNTLQFSYVLAVHEIGKGTGLTSLSVPRLTKRLLYDTCQHLGTKNQETFTPTAAVKSFPLNPAGSLDAENLGKKKIEADQSFTALRTFIRRFRSIKEISSHFTQKWPRKILIYALEITFKSRIFTGSNRPGGRFWKLKVGLFQ